MGASEQQPLGKARATPRITQEKRAQRLDQAKRGKTKPLLKGNLQEFGAGGLFAPQLQDQAPLGSILPRGWLRKGAKSLPELQGSGSNIPQLRGRLTLGVCPGPAPSCTTPRVHQEGELGFLKQGEHQASGSLHPRNDGAATGKFKFTDPFARPFSQK